jgi:bile acid:Na+ symporter, BASS family
MQGDVVSSVLMPMILAFISFSLGLGVTLLDFQHIARRPRALAVGLICHFLLLPMVCYALIQAFGFQGAFAVGFMILAASPTGSTSNLLTYIARGDVALALSFTAAASVLTILTMPFIVSWSVQHFMNTTRTIQVPITFMMAQIFVVLAMPVTLGMTLRHLKPDFARRFEPFATKVSTVLFIVIVLIAAAKNWTLLTDNFTTLAPMSMSLNIAMLGLGFALARLAYLSRREAITLGIESSIQSAALAIVIASSVLKEDAMAVPAGVYGVVMYFCGLVFAFAMRARAH